MIWLGRLGQELTEGNAARLVRTRRNPASRFRVVREQSDALPTLFSKALPGTFAILRGLEGVAEVK